ncbi:MAG: hypothetical protein JST84_08485 [Acidobacteria bacterium]|nr:hypothetical protein [Acidobacteriota bacterium]
MTLLSHLQDQFRHMEWADAMVWQAVFASESALADDIVRARLHHIHLVQRVFLAVWQGEFAHCQDSNERQAAIAPWVNKGSELRGKDLLAWGQSYYENATPYLATLSESDLAQPVALPWTEMMAAIIGRPLATSLLAETLQQVTMHSAYHRGQANARLREVGAEPPSVDFIMWIWLGKPFAHWQTDNSQ